jgi:superfamily I DNA and/or RNA helicase
MTLPDSYHPIRYLLPKEGRLLLAGDHEQLPPIINGKDSPHEKKKKKKKKDKMNIRQD